MIRCPKCGHEWNPDDSLEPINQLRAKRAAVIKQMHQMDAMPNSKHSSDQWRKRRAELKNAVCQIDIQISAAVQTRKQTYQKNYETLYHLAVDTAYYYMTAPDYKRFKEALEKDSVPMNAGKEMRNYPSR